MERNRISGAARHMSRDMANHLRGIVDGAGHRSAAQLEAMYDDIMAFSDRTPDQARRMTSEALAQGREACERGARRLSRQLSAHPFAALLAAGVAGAALALLARSSLRP